jgi:aminopeptidase N
MLRKNTLKMTIPLALLAAAASACSSARKKDPSTEPESAAQASASRVTSLSREAAHLRSKQISHVTYTLWFGLDESHDDYEARTVINFELKPKAQDLSNRLLIDLEGGSVRTLTLNGQSLVASERFDGHHITLRSAELHAGSNRVEIAYTHGYSHNGAGLHRFKDPADGRVYLYSNFEPYDAHRMFPCFDQPDLKASFEVTAEAPEDWQVISNTPERDVAKVDGRKSWQFPPSPVFSTYVFALHAGPYASWKGNAAGIPTRLFARQSIKQYVDADEWLDVTERGLQWYGEYFGYPYPYSKYDQLIVPDFNAGAMENVGAVTFSERYVHRSRITTDTRRHRAGTILHEMAHMWFGDLVTMRWWNGLWLNESFATFMSAKAVNEATQFKGSWQDFFSGEKEWAYWEDQLVTTHPIEGPVFDTDQAETNFDGITYGKGAAVLKQLNYLLGDEDFREGLQRYFQKYALRNTTVNDFIRMLAEASSKDLGKWQKAWLQSSGVNTLRADWSCDGGRLASLKLVQKMPEPAEAAKELRSHRAQVALFELKAGKLKAGKTYTVTYADAETPVREAVGAPCPALVYPNYGDYDYVKVELDPASLKTAQASLARIEDPFVRQMLWDNLWEMVTDGKLRAQDYAEIVLTQAASEKDTQVLSRVLKSLVDPLQDDTSVMKYLAGKQRDEMGERIERFARAHLPHAAPGSDLQLIWFHALLDSLRSDDAREYARKLLDGKARISGLKIDQDRRWELIQALARTGAPGSAELIAAELKSDGTDMGQKQAIRAQASMPVAATKAQWLDEILGRKEPFPKLREAMRAFHVLGQEDLSRAAVDPYFAMLPKLASLGDEEYMRRFTSSMYPGLCDPLIVKRTTEALATMPQLPITVLKPLKVGRQEEERCVRARRVSDNLAGASASEMSPTPVVPIVPAAAAAPAAPGAPAAQVVPSTPAASAAPGAKTTQ